MIPGLGRSTGEGTGCPFQFSWASLADQLVKNLSAVHSAGDLGSLPGLGRVPWRRERPPTPVFWPGEFHGLCSPWGHKESDTTKQLSFHCQHVFPYFDYRKTRYKGDPSVGKNRSCSSGRRPGPEELEKQQGTVFRAHRAMTVESRKTDTILF